MSQYIPVTKTFLRIYSPYKIGRESKYNCIWMHTYKNIQIHSPSKHPSIKEKILILILNIKLFFIQRLMNSIFMCRSFKIVFYLIA